MILKRDLMPEASQKEMLDLEPEERWEVGLHLKDEATRKFQMTLSVASPDGKTKYYSRSYPWEAAPPWQWKVAGEARLPVDFQFSYYPYLDLMRILMDVTGLSRDAELDHVSVAIRQKKSEQLVKTVNFDQFINGQQEQLFDLPPLEGEYEIAVTVGLFGDMLERFAYPDVRK